ncbi:MAG: HEPN domain-containing protein [Parcubacteria group bacterium]
MKEFIRNYKQKGLIKEEEIGFDQIIKHLTRATKDLKVAEANLKIDSEAAYTYAYLAMLRAGRGLMFSFGLRPIDGEQHKTVVQFCEHVLGDKFSETVDYFDLMRKKRNRFTYDEPGLLVSESEISSALANACKLVRAVYDFIQEKNLQQKLI